MASISDVRQSAAGQGQRACGDYRYDACCCDMHQLPDNMPINYAENVHDYCGYCVIGTCHPLCGLTDDEQDALLALEAALSRRDVSRVLSVLPALRKHLSLNKHRISVQVASACDPSFLIGNLPLERGMWEAVAPMMGLRSEEDVSSKVVEGPGEGG